MKLTPAKKLRLQPHHLAWLSCHPDRSAEWLADRLADNFHVHHVDGDHCNDEPHNLVLLEGLDHMLLYHGMKNYKLNAIAGRAGGLAAAKNMTAKQRISRARKAGKATARNRRALKAQRQGAKHLEETAAIQMETELA